MINYEYAIEVGSSYTSIYKKGYGIVLREPSAVAVEIENTKEKYQSFGVLAKKMVGRTSVNNKIIYPIKNGAISNLPASIAMLNYFFNKIKTHKFFKTSFNLLFCVPCGLSNEELGDFTDLAIAVGAKKVDFIPSVLTSLIGAGINIAKPTGILSLNMGGGTCNAASVSLNTIIKGYTAHIGGKRIDEAISIYLEEFDKLIVGENQAEKIKNEVGSLFLHDKTDIEISGIDVENNQPKSAIITSADLRETLDFYFEKIVATIMQVINESTADLVSDFSANGIVVTGGLANITGIDQYLKNALNLPITIADNPETASIIGAGKLLSDKTQLKDILEKN